MTMVEADADLPEGKSDAERALGILRTVDAPGGQRNIVTAGFVKEIEVTDKGVSITFAPNTRSQDKVEAMEAGIRNALGAEDIFENIEIQRCKPFSDDSEASGQRPAPKKARADLALDAGYGLDGPPEPGGPAVPTASPVYEGKLPVLQWEIDPQNAAAKSGNADLTVDGWDFRMWWQEHESGLLYTSIQAMQDDSTSHDGEARSHPVGRMEAVNLVFDKERKAVIAIYGTVRDFRPFVEAFYQSYVLKN